MPAVFEVSAVAKVPKEAVWKVLADFPNIADHTKMIASSVATNEEAFGVGASRRCNLAPMGTSEETITEVAPNERLSVWLYKTTGLPVKQSQTTFSLTAIDANTTELTMRSEIQAKGGPLAGLIGKVLARRLPKGAQLIVRDLAASAERIGQVT